MCMAFAKQCVRLWAVALVLMFHALVAVQVQSQAQSQAQAQVQRYDRLCTAGDDYSTAFRSTRGGTEIWFNSSFGMRNPESRRLVRVHCDTSGGNGFAPLPAPVNQEERDAFRRVLDGSPTFPVCDTSYGLFASNRLFNGENMDNDIYELISMNGAWQVRRADALNSDGWDDSPSLSADGNTVFFASSRGRFKGTGLTDIYMSRKGSRGWDSPIRVVAISTDSAREEAPFLGSDGYLYFSSDRSGDMDIYRVRVDNATGTMLGSVEPVPFEGVNRKGSDEGVPSLSAGGAWLLFSSNRRADTTGKKDYDIYMTRVLKAADTIDIKVEMRTQFYNTVFEDYEDQTLPCTTEVIARDKVSGEVITTALSGNGTARIVLPRNGVSEPCMDYRYRSIVVSAKPPVVDGKDYESETDTLVFDVMSSVNLSHNFYLWDKAMPQERECVQNFRVVQVQFFLTCYWCPTTMQYASFAQCQSVFNNPECTQLEVHKPTVQCKDGDIYSYRLNYEEPTVSVLRNPGLCIPAKEIRDEEGKREWSVRVDSAINKFITEMRASLQRPCVQRAIRRGEVIDVSVIGWTDPRGIDPVCM